MSSISNGEPVTTGAAVIPAPGGVPKQSPDAPDGTGVVSKGTRFRSDRLADRVMRRMLRVTAKDRRAADGAHRAFRTSVVISGIRCLITYLLLPILVPILSISGWVAAPIGLGLCVIALVNGVVSVRRFWVSDHKYRWLYTGFMVVVFLILTLALVSDLGRLGVW